MDDFQTYMNFYILTCILCSSCLAISRPTNIVLENNGYKHILVGIHPSVPEDKNLIADIKSMFEEGSSFLYNATYKRAYYKEVTILLPATWSDDSSYSPATSEIYANADIEFTTPTLAKNGHRRQTRSYSGCGSPGIRIHFTPEIFSNNNTKVFEIDTLGPRGRFLVHEWAHFRWGVYDEFAEDGEQQFYVSPSSGKVEDVRCNFNMKGLRYRIVENNDIKFCRAVDDKTGRFPDDCLFLPYNRGHYANLVSASIMHRVYVPGIKYFCNDDTSDPKRIHNYEAPNKQNRLCGQRSTWSVILETPDFKNNNNAPRDVTDIKPVFKVVKAVKTRRVVMALDTSGSMMNDDANGRLRQAAADYIHNGIGSHTEVGLISFNEKGTILHPMTALNDQTDRDRLKRSLPHKTGGATSLGAGIQKAIELLSKDGRNASGAEVIILSDGKETSHPKIDDVLATVKSEGAIITVLAFNQATEDNVSHAAHSSGGRYFFDNNQAESTTLSDALFKMRRDPALNINDSAIQLKSDSTVLWKGKHLSGKVSVDEDIGRNTVFTIMYSKIEPSITIVSPTGRLFNSRYPEYKADHLFNTVRIEIPEIAERGSWSYKITSKHQSPQKVTIMISSEPVDNLRYPISIEGGVASVGIRHMIWAEVNKGSHPVLGMDVVAVVDRPYEGLVRIKLLDNGAGADITKDDGVYCRYFTQFSGYGRYSVKVEVRAEKGKGLLKKSERKQINVHLTNDDSGMTIREKREVFFEPLLMSLSRSTTAGTFQHKKLSFVEDIDELEADLFSPVRITDLSLMKTSHEEQTVMLSWTAPGDDLDFDTAFKYEIIVSTSTEDMIRDLNSMRLVKQEEIVYGDLLKPQEAGTREIYVVKISLDPNANTSFVFSVRADDKTGNMADKSNFVTAGFGFVPDYTSKDYVPLALTSTEAPPGPSSTHITILVSIVGTLTAAMLFTVVLSICLYKFAGPDKFILKDHYSKANIV